MNLTGERRKVWEKWFWFLVLKGSFIQRAVAEKLMQLGDTEGLFETTIIYKDTKVLGFAIGKRLQIVEWLVDNNNLEKFEAYHSDWRDGPWEKSKLDKKTPAERKQNEPIAQQLRDKKKKHLK